MTRVLVDLLFHSGARGGTETYVRELYSRLGDEPAMEFIGFASREMASAGAPWFPGRLIDSGVPGNNRAAWAAGEIFAVARAARREHADVIHSPANLGPVRSSVPVVLTLHDLLPFRHPEWVPVRAVGGLLRWMIRGAARHAARIITISEASAADIRDVLDIPDGRIDVIPLGSEAEPAGEPGNGHVVVSPGNRMPHKNQAVLLRALALIPPATRPIVEFTGGSDDDPLPALAEALGVRDSVRVHRWLTTEELRSLYGRATVVALPTRFEGFGLPVLEAMAQRRPVVCSDLPVLREVAGDAATYVDPDDPAAWAAALTALTGDPALARRQVDAGTERAALFSWARTASATAASLRAAVSAG